MAIKHKVIRFGHYIKSYFIFHDKIKNYEAGLRYVNRKNNQIKKLVLLVNFPESWNSLKSIYDEALRKKDIEVKILAVPRISEESENATDMRSGRNEAYDFFTENNIEAIRADLGDNSWFDLKSLEPDYVIYTRPYKYQYPEAYRSYNVCSYAKLFYVPYAYGMLGEKVLFTVLPEDFVFTMRKIYFANKSRMEEARRCIPRYGKNTADRYTYLGFPRFDMYSSGSMKTDTDERYKTTIVWLPRWTSEKFNSVQKSSHFLEYYKDFIEFAKDNSDIRLIIRPHPMMLSHYLSEGVMTEEDVKSFRGCCNITANIVIDEEKDYMNTLNKADIMVTDYTSLIAEFFITGKPIVFCDDVTGLNEEGKKICSCLYYADKFDSVVEYIDILRSGNDDMKEIRQNLISNILPVKTGEIGKSILEDILNS